MEQSLPSSTWNQTKIKGTKSAHKIKQKIKCMKCNKKNSENMMPPRKKCEKHKRKH
jgi:hypothetical protein